MDAVSLGPVVLSLERFSAFLGFLTLVISAEVLARRGFDSLSSWATNAVLVSLSGARLGYVLSHLSSYVAEPLSIFYLWQGGFSALGALLAGALYTVWIFRARWNMLKAAVLPVALALCVWLGVSTLSAVPSGSAQTLPSLELEALGENPIALTSFVGTPTVLNLWATWCGPCRRELPLLAEVARTRDDVAFVFVDLRERPETVATYLLERNISLKNVLIDKRGHVAQAFRARGTPTSLFFNAEGTLVKRHVGELSRAALNDYLVHIGP